MSDISISLSITEQKGLSNHTSLKRLKKQNKKPTHGGRNVSLKRREQFLLRQ